MPPPPPKCGLCASAAHSKAPSLNALVHLRSVAVALLCAGMRTHKTLSRILAHIPTEPLPPITRPPRTAADTLCNAHPAWLRFCSIGSFSLCYTVGVVVVRVAAPLLPPSPPSLLTHLPLAQRRLVALLAKGLQPARMCGCVFPLMAAAQAGRTQVCGPPFLPSSPHPPRDVMPLLWSGVRTLRRVGRSQRHMLSSQHVLLGLFICCWVHGAAQLGATGRAHMLTPPTLACMHARSVFAPVPRRARSAPAFPLTGAALCTAAQISRKHGDLCCGAWPP